MSTQVYAILGIAVFGITMLVFALAEPRDDEVRYGTAEDG